MFQKLLLILVLFLLPACAQTELASHLIKQTPISGSVHAKSKGDFKIGNSYVIKGQRYTPRETYDFTQTGIASWYGPNFHGKKTANGEVFDKFDLTAAHKTLQMPSIIRVTNLENGRSVILRVNDRGPFSKGRVLDVSERGAELLDFRHQGTARVRIELLSQESMEVASLAKQGRSTRGYEVALNQRGYEPKPTRMASLNQVPTQASHQAPTPKPAPIAKMTPPQPLVKPGALFVQAGSFSNAVKAQAFAQKVQGIAPARINPTFINGSKFYRVQLGPIQTQSHADQIVAHLASSNIGEPFLIRE